MICHLVVSGKGCDTILEKLENDLVTPKEIAQKIYASMCVAANLAEPYIIEQ